MVASIEVSTSRALQPQAVDFALDVLEPGLGLLEQQIGAPFGLADDALASCSAFALMSSDSFWAVISVFWRFFSCSRCSVSDASIRLEVLAEPVGLAQRLLVVVGDRGQERGDLDRVEAAERSCENAAGAGRAG